MWPVTRHSAESNAFARLYFTDAFTFACAIVKRARASCSSGVGASALLLLDGMPLRCFSVAPEERLISQAFQGSAIVLFVRLLGSQSAPSFNLFGVLPNCKAIILVGS